MMSEVMNFVDFYLPPPTPGGIEITDQVMIKITYSPRVQLIMSRISSYQGNQ